MIFIVIRFDLIQIWILKVQLVDSLKVSGFPSVVKRSYLCLTQTMRITHFTRKFISIFFIIKYHLFTNAQILTFLIFTQQKQNDSNEFLSIPPISLRIAIVNLLYIYCVYLFLPYLFIKSCVWLTLLYWHYHFYLILFFYNYYNYSIQIQNKKPTL